MYRIALLPFAWLGVAGLVLAAAPPEAAVQGLYEGVRKDAQGEHKLEARVVAWGKGTYKVFVREPAPDGKVAKVELDGKAEGDAVRFSGKGGDAAWAASYADGAIQGTVGQDGKLEVKRVERKPPTLGAKPPAGAIVLLDGRNFDELTKGKLRDGSEQPWKIAKDGGVEIPRGGMNVKRRLDGSFKLHVEFKINLRPEARGQGRGNSGVYLPNGDEIQVLDSFGTTTYKGGGCGGLYAYKDPDAFDEFSLASLPPLEWQTFDVEYHVQRKDGKLVGKPRVTVLQNGVKIHDNVELERAARPGGFHFQDHGNPIQYRNIWVEPIGEK